MGLHIQGGEPYCFCTCALHPHDNSSSFQSLTGFTFFLWNSENLIFVHPCPRQSVFRPPDHAAIWPTFTTPLPCPPAIAPEVSSTPEGLQATVIASRACDHLTTSGNRKFIAIHNANAPSPPAEGPYGLAFCLHGTFLCHSRWHPLGRVVLRRFYFRNKGVTHAMRMASKDLVEIFREAHCPATACSTCCR